MVAEVPSAVRVVVVAGPGRRSNCHSVEIEKNVRERDSELSREEKKKEGERSSPKRLRWWWKGQLPCRLLSPVARSASGCVLVLSPRFSECATSPKQQRLSQPDTATSSPTTVSSLQSLDLTRDACWFCLPDFRQSAHATSAGHSPLLQSPSDTLDLGFDLDTDRVSDDRREISESNFITCNVLANRCRHVVYKSTIGVYHVLSHAFSSLQLALSLHYFVSSHIRLIKQLPRSKIDDHDMPLNLDLVLWNHRLRNTGSALKSRSEYRVTLDQSSSSRVHRRRPAIAWDGRTSSETSLVVVVKGIVRDSIKVVHRSPDIPEHHPITVVMNFVTVLVINTLFGVLHDCQVVWPSNTTANDRRDMGKCRGLLTIMWVSPNTQSDRNNSGEELYGFTCHGDFEFSSECMMDFRLGEGASSFPMPWWLFPNVG
ncbi:hypothetical protein Sjap_021217 [Stephania japonica]|uniref:Uncharacterized protein n=1 Tax=Stephania japonica TaxID=461633 RepID=A0AAP0EP53_9MAGN